MADQDLTQHIKALADLNSRAIALAEQGKYTEGNSNRAASYIGSAIVRLGMIQVDILAELKLANVLLTDISQHTGV